MASSNPTQSQQDQDRLFAEIDVEASSKDLVPKLAKMLQATFSSTSSMEQQGDAAYKLTFNWMKSKDMKLSQAKDLATKVRQKVEFELWRESRSKASAALSE